jgi:hypothetical protein
MRRWLPALKPISAQETHMNSPLLAAAALSVLTCAVHVFYGGARVHRPVLASNAPRLALGVMSVVWHGITALLLVNAVALLYAALNPGAAMPMVVLIAAQYFAAAALSFIYGITRFGSVLVMPHWVVFLAMAALAVWGIGAR